MAPPDPAAACDLVIELLASGALVRSVGSRHGGERLVRLAHHGTEASAAQMRRERRCLRSRATDGGFGADRPDPFRRRAGRHHRIRNNHPGLIDDKDRALVERIAGLLAPPLGRPPAPGLTSIIINALIGASGAKGGIRTLTGCPTEFPARTLREEHSAPYLSSSGSVNSYRPSTSRPPDCLLMMCLRPTSCNHQFARTFQM